MRSVESIGMLLGRHGQVPAYHLEFSIGLADNMELVSHDLGFWLYFADGNPVRAPHVVTTGVTLALSGNGPQ